MPPPHPPTCGGGKHPGPSFPASFPGAEPYGRAAVGITHVRTLPPSPPIVHPVTPTSCSPAPHTPSCPRPVRLPQAPAASVPAGAGLCSPGPVATERAQPVAVGCVSLTTILRHGDQWGLRECEHHETISVEVCVCAHVCMCLCMCALHICVSLHVYLYVLYVHVCVWCLSELLVIHVTRNRNPKSHFQITTLQ